MRKLFFGLVVGVAALLGTQTAQAGNLTSITLSLALGTLPALSFNATGLVGAGTASGTGVGAAWNLSGGVAPTGSATTTVVSSAAPPITQLKFLINGNPGACAFVATGGGPCAVVGAANITGLNATLLKIPLTIGVPVVIKPPVAYGIGITAFANDWTTKTTGVHLNTPPTGVPATASATAMGLNGLVGGAGTVILVSALNVLTSIAGQLPTFAVLTLNYAAPEPGTLLLLGSGIAGLAVIGRRKMRK